MSTEAMKLALEALKQMQAKANFECWNLDICDEAIKALEEALAKQEEGKSFFKFRECEDSQANQPKQEQGEPCDMGELCIGCSPKLANGKCPATKPNGACDCYVTGFNDGMKEMDETTPQQRTTEPTRQWVGLTNEEIDYYIVHRFGVATKKNLVELIRLCEANLKEKNT
jgi:hypothetical protein